MNPNISLTFPNEKKISYSKGAPVVIISQNLIKNLPSDSIYSVLGIKSLSMKKIIAIKVAFDLFDIESNKLDESTEYNYLDLSLNYNQTIGTDKPIVIHKNARNYVARVTLVVFEDMSKWVGEENPPFENFESFKPLTDGIDLLNTDIYKSVTSEKSSFFPQQFDGIWRCSCGNVVDDDKQFCVNCQCEKERIFSWFDNEKLSQKAAEMNEQKEKEYAQNAEKYGQMIKNSKSDLLISALIAAVILILTFVKIPVAKVTHDYSSVENKLKYYGEYSFVETLYNNEDLWSRASRDFCNFVGTKYSKIKYIEKDGSDYIVTLKNGEEIEVSASDDYDYYDDDDDDYDYDYDDYDDYDYYDYY